MKGYTDSFEGEAERVQNTYILEGSISVGNEGEVLIVRTHLAYSCFLLFSKYLAFTATKWYPTTVTMASSPREFARL